MAKSWINVLSGTVVDATDLTNFPWGKAQDVTTYLDGTGFPWRKLVANDFIGHHAAVLTEAGLTPNDLDETAVNSQILTGSKIIHGIVVNDLDDLLTQSTDLPLGTTATSSEVGKEGQYVIKTWSAETDDDELVKVNGTWSTAGKYWGKVLPPTVSGYTASAVRYIADELYIDPVLAVEIQVAETVYESVGPTGSGADNIWTALDGLPDHTSMVTLSVGISATTTTTSPLSSLEVLARKTGSALTSFKQQVSYIGFNSPEGSSVTQETNSTVDIPIDENKMFDIYWNEANTTTATVSLRLRGFLK